MKQTQTQTYGLLDGSQHAALDVGDGLGVDGGQLMDEPVVQRQQGQVEEETLPYRVLGPRSRHLCSEPQEGLKVSQSPRGAK